jgi:hypothetical protein
MFTLVATFRFGTQDTTHPPQTLKHMYSDDGDRVFRGIVFHTQARFAENRAQKRQHTAVRDEFSLLQLWAMVWPILVGSQMEQRGCRNLCLENVFSSW